MIFLKMKKHKHIKLYYMLEKEEINCYSKKKILMRF